MENYSKYYVYLCFDIFNIKHFKIGGTKVLIHKQLDLNKWKEPSLCANDAIKEFKKTFAEYSDYDLTAIYTGDLIPIIQ